MNLLDATKKQFFQEAFQEGIQAGIQEGIQEGIKKTAIQMIKEGIEATLVVRFRRRYSA